MSVRSTLRSGIRGHSTTGEGAAVTGCNMADDANQVQIAIQDSKGLTVRTVTLGKTQAGDRTLAWDVNNSPLPSGIYSFSVNTVQADGSRFNDTHLIRSAADGNELPLTT